ncbi:hypothetical protein HYW35_03580 [Candidatus Saccharibacteria bacterium]|nr:hypothetical protein [Candidatus Saccharibacteria bacterium]
MNALIRLLYALLIAGAVVTFVGLGIYSFYQPPKYPQYPNYNSVSADDTVYQQQQKEFEKATEAYDKKEKAYQRNVTLAVLPLAVVFVVGGSYWLKRSDVIGEGVALGGIATTMYAIITSSIADARILRFLSVTLLLASVLFVTHRRFYSKELKT